MRSAGTHERDNARGTNAAEVGEDEFAHTCANGQRISEDRARQRAHAKSIAREAATETCGIAGVARSLGFKSETSAAKLCNRDDPMPLVLGDVMAADPAWAELVLSGALAYVRGRVEATPASIDRELRMLFRDSGQLSDLLDKALANDGVIDSGEARPCRQSIRQIRRRLDQIDAKLDGEHGAKS